VRYHYAIQYPCGVASNEDGTRCGTYYRFASKSKRDAWVAEHASTPRTDAGFREPVPADRETRAVVRWVDAVARDESGQWVTLPFAFQVGSHL
jgi:hypothetical protein